MQKIRPTRRAPHKVPVNDSALIPFRLIDVHSEQSEMGSESSFPRFPEIHAVLIRRTEELLPFLSDLRVQLKPIM